MDHKRVITDFSLPRILRLNENQINLLFQQAINGAKEFETGSDSPCLRFAGHTDKKGYPRNITLGKRQRVGYQGRGKYQKEEDPLMDVPFDATWSAGQVVLVKHSQFPPSDGKVWQASHLCDHPWCVRNDHIIWEVDKDNYDRKKCGFRVVCEKCGHVNLMCKHEPHCFDMTDCKCPLHSRD